MEDALMKLGRQHTHLLAPPLRLRLSPLGPLLLRVQQRSVLRHTHHACFAVGGRLAVGRGGGAAADARAAVTALMLGGAGDGWLRLLRALRARFRRRRIRLAIRYSPPLPPP